MGEILGLVAAMIWATSSTLMRTQTARIGAVAVNFWRCLINIPVFLVLYLIFVPHDALAQLGTGTLLIVFIAVTLGLVTGDSIQYHSIKMIGVSRAMPVGATFPLFTVCFAWLINGDPLRVQVLAGAVVVIVGVVLISLPKRKAAPVGIVAQPVPRTLDRTLVTGIGLSLFAAMCWSLSTVLQGMALTNADPITVNLIRMPVATLLLFAAARGNTGQPLKRHGWRSFAALVGIGLFGTGAGSLTYLGALKYAGAGKTAVLGACAPLFALPLAMLVHGERPGLRGFLGTALTVCGIVLVVTS